MTMETDTTAARDLRLSRRRMLARLGLVAGAAYVAPVMLQLGEAKASGRSGRGSFSGRRRPRPRPRRSFSR